MRDSVNHKIILTISQAGILGALPHLLMTIIVPFGGMLADHLRKSGIMSTTNVRKVFNCGGFGLEGLFFLFVAHSTTGVSLMNSKKSIKVLKHFAFHQQAGAVTALTFGVAFSGFAISGYNVNHLDIAPRYASILMGMSNGIGTIAGLLCPIVIDYLTRDRVSYVFILKHFKFWRGEGTGDFDGWREVAVKQEGGGGGRIGWRRGKRKVDTRKKKFAREGGEEGGKGVGRVRGGRGVLKAENLTSLVPSLKRFLKS